LEGEKILQLLKNEDGGKDGSWKLEDLNGRLQEERKDGPISIGADFSPLSGINTPLGFSRNIKNKKYRILIF